MKMKTRTIICVLAALLVGCGGPVTPTSLITDLQAVGDAASVAVVTAEALQVAGVIPASVAQTVISAGQATAAAVTQSVTELGSTDSNPMKISRIILYFTAVPINTAGMPPAAAALIGAISAAVQVLLTDLGNAQVVSAAKAAPQVSPITLLTNGDKIALKAINTKAMATLTAAETWEAAHGK
jgi:hypothetical protein